MINFGIIGIGNIAHRVAKGILCSKKANLYAVASRDKDNAEQFQKQYGAEKAYGSYKELLEDAAVDAVYICTPNSLHYEQIQLCLSYGKHVVCEKPMVANSEQVKELFAQARKAGCFLMEAEKTMFTPLNVKLKEMIESGVIGKLRAIRAEYSYQVLEEVDEDHWVLDKNMGGSAYDIGVYPISFSHYFANSKIENLIVKRVDHPKYECDFGMQADICYENGVYGFLQSNWFYTPEHKGSAILAGEDGYIEVPAFWKGTKAYLHKNGIVEEIEAEMESDFEGEVTHAAECIENNMLESPVLGECMSLEIIKVVEGIL
jgi:predicted dehydrogenase